MVVDLKELKTILEREVLQLMDHKFLNQEVPAFATQDSDHREHCRGNLESSRPETYLWQAASNKVV